LTLITNNLPYILCSDIVKRLR